MYGQPPPNAHPLQHAQPFDLSDELSVDPHTQPAMDAPDFAPFFSFDTIGDGINGSIHDPTALMSLHADPHPAALSSAPFVSEPLPANNTPMAPSHPQPQHKSQPSHPRPAESRSDSSISKATFDGATPSRKSSMAATAAATAAAASSPEDGPKRERMSSAAADTLDGPQDDDFELPSSRGRADGTDLGGGARTSKDGSRSEAAPSWSELKTKAGKDRKRLPLACIACRRKKIRCSGEKPACKHCLRSRIPCVYKVTTRKAAPRTDYMAMLDKRLKRMEERIIKVIPRSDQGPTSSVTRAVVKPAIPGTLGSAKGPAAPRKRGADEAFGAGLEAWAKSDTRNGMDDDGFSPSPPHARESDENQLLQEGRDALPSKDIQEHLAEVYFDNLYGQAYPLLHKPSYMRKLASNTLPPVLVLSVCAVAARFSASPKLSSQTRQFLRGEEWAGPARDICTRRYESPNITILTCLLILGLHEFGTCQGGRSWALGGQATRMAFALQLHKDLEYDPMYRGTEQQAKLSFVDREIRRRIMWSCFLMDRFNSSGTERPMFIMEDSLHIPLPVKERHFQLDMPAVTEMLDGTVPPDSEADLDAAGDARENMGVTAFMIKAVAQWGHIIAYVNQGGKESDDVPMWSETSTFSRLSREVDAFISDLPEPLHYSLDNIALHQNHHTSNQFILLHIIIQQNVLFLSRTALGPVDGKPEAFVTGARSRAFAAADRVSEILREAETSRVLISAPVVGYCAFSSTTMHIRGIVSGDPALKATAEANATTNIRFLRKMMKFWGMFHWMEEDVRTQYRRALDRSRSGLPPDDGSVTSPILQYGDWFNRYPHGVSDADFMDPAAQRKREKGADGVLEQKPELHSVEEFFTMLSSPKTTTASSDHQAQNASQSSASTTGRRKSAAKKGEKATPKMTNQQKQKPPPLDMTVPVPKTSSAPITPGIQQQPQPQQLHQPQPQQQPRRPSAPLVSTPSAFHTLATSLPQNANYHSMSPISPVDQFHPSRQAQSFFPPNMMPMGMPPQQAPPSMMQQPLDQHLSFGAGNFPMEPQQGQQQHVMGAVQWHGGGNGQQMQGQAAVSMGMEQQHMQAQQAPNGVNPDGWFVHSDMQADPAFNGMFGGGGMHAQNPLGGLRHGH